MRIRTQSVILFSSFILFSCKESKPNLQLQEISSKELIIDFDKYDFYKGTIFYEKDNIANVFYVNKNDSTLVARSMEDVDDVPRYTIPIENYENLLNFNVQNDTLILHYKNNVVNLKTFEKWEQTLEIPIDTSIYNITRFSSDRFMMSNGDLFLTITSRISSNFIDTFRCIMYDFNANTIKKICKFPAKFKDEEYYFRYIHQTILYSNIFFVFEKCDSVLFYDKKNIDREAENYIPIFTDLSRVLDTPYDNSKARDMEYVMKYASTAEVNVPVFQKQDSDQLYVVKRLYKAKRADKDQYVLGKIKDKKYIGYCYLPDDYNVAAQFIKNDTLYYLSLLNNKTTWKGFKISEL